MIIIRSAHVDRYTRIMEVIFWWPWHVIKLANPKCNSHNLESWPRWLGNLNVFHKSEINNEPKHNKMAISMSNVRRPVTPKIYVNCVCFNLYNQTVFPRIKDTSIKLEKNKYTINDEIANLIKTRSFEPLALIFSRKCKIL